MYQGLALPNMPLVALANKLSFLSGNWGFCGQSQSDAMTMAFESFVLDMGLYGTPFKWKYADYGSLATRDTWFQNLWKLADEFMVQIEFGEADTIHGIRDGDRSLMSEFFRQGYRSNELVALNTVRCC